MPSSILSPSSNQCDFIGRKNSAYFSKVLFNFLLFFNVYVWNCVKSVNVCSVDPRHVCNKFPKQITRYKRNSEDGMKLYILQPDKLITFTCKQIFLPLITTIKTFSSFTSITNIKSRLIFIGEIHKHCSFWESYAIHKLNVCGYNQGFLF